MLSCLSQTLERVAQEVGGAQVGMVFLDHCKPCLLPDLRRMEVLGLVAPGTVVVADNVIYPGAPGMGRRG
jgi:predicted O-methyltransferase YrrM